MKPDQTTPPSIRPWSLPARQQRSRATRDRLLVAAESIIREKGEPDIAMSDVAARAGCSVGALYRRFEDKEALLHALHDRWVSESRGALESLLDPKRWEGMRIEEILDAYLHLATRITHIRAGLSRASLLMALRDPSFADRQNDLHRLLDRGLRRLLLDRRAEIRHPDPERAVTFVLEQLRASLMARRFGAPIHFPSRLSDASFIAEALVSARTHLGLAG